MVLVAIILAGALLSGWLSGGRLRNVAQVTVRAIWLVFVAAGLQIVLGVMSLVDGPVEVAGRPLLIASYLFLLGFIAWNRRMPGMLLLFVGFGLNAAVVLVNGAMPVSAAALIAAGGPAEVELGKHQLLTADHQLPWLADIIAVPVLRTVVSVGDVVLAAGAGLLIISLMRRHGRRSPPATEPSQQGRGSTSTAEPPQRGVETLPEGHPGLPRQGGRGP